MRESCGRGVSRVLLKLRQLWVFFQNESACFSAFLIFFLKTKYFVSPVVVFRTASMRQGSNESHLKHSPVNFSKTSHKHFGFSHPPFITLSVLISMVYPRPPNRNGIARSIQVKGDTKRIWGVGEKKRRLILPPDRRKIVLGHQGLFWCTPEIKKQTLQLILAFSREQLSHNLLNLCSEGNGRSHFRQLLIFCRSRVFLLNIGCLLRLFPSHRLRFG